ncbi:hypothetical protein BE15_13490 [Sorangium cellulosum]|uniref:Uncharacterized protein n=1 Tax=Sorangium cellulosum TaxID=56 RepID=A0A150QLH1_SORCE|nr:hypothetical protein BE15_13490 [Sorangium cellulosum]
MTEFVIEPLPAPTKYAPYSLWCSVSPSSDCDPCATYTPYMAVMITVFLTELFDDVAKNCGPHQREDDDLMVTGCAAVPFDLSVPLIRSSLLDASLPDFI